MRVVSFYAYFGFFGGGGGGGGVFLRRDFVQQSKL